MRCDTIIPNCTGRGMKEGDLIMEKVINIYPSQSLIQIRLNCTSRRLHYNRSWGLVYSQKPIITFCTFNKIKIGAVANSMLKFNPGARSSICIALSSALLENLEYPYY